MVTLQRLVTGQGSRQGLWFLPLVLCFLGCGWLLIQTDDFSNPQNLRNLAAQALPLIIVSLGQTLVILVGHLDLSVGSVVSLSTVLLALGGSPLILVPTVFAVAAFIGLLNGLVITRLNVNPIVVTLAMQWIILGITRVIRPVSGGTVPDIVVRSVSGIFPVVWIILIGIVGWKLIHGSRFGLHLFSIGGGVQSGRQEAAQKFGINNRRNILISHVLCSTFAALAGVFFAGRIVSGDPNVGLLLELDSITAVAIGGTQLTGGVGSLQGTLIGAGLLALLANGMNLQNVSAFVQTIVKGLILLAVVGFQSRKKMGL